MDTVKWAHSTDMEPDDVMVSDNLLDFVKDDDIVTGLETHDDILQQGNTQFSTVFARFFSPPLLCNYSIVFLRNFQQIFSTKLLTNLISMTTK